MADNNEQNQDVSEEVLEEGGAAFGSMSATQAGSSVTDGAAHAIAENPLEEVAHAAGKEVGEFMLEVKEAAAQAGVYLDDKSLEDLGEQLWNHKDELGEDINNVLTDPATWETAADSVSNAIETTYDVVSEAGKLVKEGHSNSTATYNDVVEAVEEGVDYTFTTPLGKIWDDAVESQAGQSVQAFGDGIVAGLKNGGALKSEFSGNALPKVPEELSQKIERQAKAERGETQPKPDEPKNSDEQQLDHPAAGI